MGMIGTQEILIVFAVIMLLFGASKLPELARSMGRSMGEFKRGQIDVERELHTTDSFGTAQSRVQRMASDMGISTMGKSDDQLLIEIEKKLEKR